jgi:hypothetical protein
VKACWKVQMCTLLDALVKMDRPLTSHIISNEGLCQPTRVVAKRMANSIVNVDLPGRVQAMARKLEMLI